MKRTGFCIDHAKGVIGVAAGDYVLRVDCCDEVATAQRDVLVKLFAEMPTHKRRCWIACSERV